MSSMKFIKKMVKRTRSLRKTMSMEGSVKEGSATSTSTEVSQDSRLTCMPMPEEESSMFMTAEDLMATNASIAKAKGLEAPTNDSFDEDTMKKRVALVRKFCRLVNAQDLTAAHSLVTDDIQVHYTDGSKTLNMEMTWEEWSQEKDKCYASFPDLRCKYRRVTHSCGVVIVQGLQCGGTHSGAPYAVGPCEPIEADFRYVENDPEELFFFFREGEEHFCRMNVCAKGDMSGPSGLYTQLGGFPLL